MYLYRSAILEDLSIYLPTPFLSLFLSSPEDVFSLL